MSSSKGAVLPSSGHYRFQQLLLPPALRKFPQRPRQRSKRNNELSVDTQNTPSSTPVTKEANKCQRKTTKWACRHMRRSGSSKQREGVGDVTVRRHTSTQHWRVTGDAESRSGADRISAYSKDQRHQRRRRRRQWRVVAGAWCALRHSSRSWRCRVMLQRHEQCTAENRISTIWRCLDS